MSAIVYFHRSSGVSYTCELGYLPRLKERLREALGDRFNEQTWEVIHVGADRPIRVRAVDKRHLDVTISQDPERLIL